MNRSRIIAISLTIALLMFSVPSPARAARKGPEKVTIQLKWHHQFQFAGYYAAKTKGFYSDENLDVRLRERRPKENHIQAVLDGRAEYGTADAGLLLFRARGKPVVLLAQIFQHSPFVFISRKDSGIISPYEMTGKKVMFDTSGTAAPLSGLISLTLGGLDRITKIPLTMKVDDLVDGRVDVMSVYITDQPYLLHKMGVEINIIDPRNYGMDFYGDNLFTTGRELREHPGRAERLRRATLRGWQYALRHPEEIIDGIINHYNPDLDRGRLRYEAKMTQQMILPDLIPLGEVKSGRYERIAELYASLKLMPTNKIPPGFFYNPARRPDMPRLNTAERNWLREHPVIRVAADASYAPFEFDDNGVFRGMSMDYLREAGRRLGVTFDIPTGKSWQDVVAMMKERRLDMYSCVVKTPQRRKYVRFTNPYLSFPVTIFTRHDAPYIASLDELKGKKVAVVQGYYLHELLKKDHPEITMFLVKDIEEALRRVADGEVYAFLGNIATVSYYIHKLGYTNLKVAGESEYQANLSMAVRNDWPEFAAILQKALNSLSREDRDRIYQKWIALRYEKKVNYAPLWQGLAVALLVVVFILYWNRRLAGEISQRREAERQLTRLNDELEQRVRERTREMEAEKAFSDTVINSLPGVFFMYRVQKNGETRLVKWNKNHETVTGFSAGELATMSPSDWFRGEDVAKAHAGIRQLFQEGRTTLELPMVNKDDSRAPYLFSAVYLKKDGEDYFLGFGIDITDRKKAETALVASEERYALAQRAANIGSWDWDIATNELQWSRETEPLFGFEPGGFGRSFDDFLGHVHRDDRRSIEYSLRAALDDDRVYDLQYRLVCPDGSQRWVRATGDVIRSDGEPVRMIGVIQDITTRKQIEEVIIQTEKMLSVGGLAAGMAHEINNPLAGIMQNIQVLQLYLLRESPNNRQLLEKHGVSPDRLREFFTAREIPAIVENIMKSGRRAAKIVDNMLSFSRKSDKVFTACNPAELLDRTVDLAANDYDLKDYDFRRIEIIREYDDDIPAVRCEANLIQQVFLNILRNGAQAMLAGRPPAESRPPRFILRVRREGKEVRTEISDNGPGMDEEIRKRAFDPFFTTKEVGVGTGLGLSVSYFIITEKHGGSMAIESAPGQGANFIIHLPINREGPWTTEKPS